MMRYKFIPLVFALLISASSPSVRAQTQLELNDKANAEYRLADKELNQAWTELMPLLRPEVKEKLITSQNLWIKFRDAEAAAMTQVYEGGSIAPLITASTLTDITRARTEQLKLWIEDSSH